MPFLPSATSYFSLMRGIYSPSMVCEIAKEMGYSSIAITDLNNLYGLAEFINYCKKYDLRAIIGAEISETNSLKNALLYAHGNIGYANLCRIITNRLNSDKFNIINEIKEYSQGIHVVTENLNIIKKLQKKASVYYRITTLNKPPALIKEMNITSLIIPKMAFRFREDYQLHKFLRAIDNNTTLSRVKPDDLFSETDMFQPWDEIYDRFEVFEQALNATEDFGSSVVSKSNFGVPVMPTLISSIRADKLLRKKCFSGAKDRYGTISTVVKERLEYELDLIVNKGFAAYFLVVDDIVKRSPRTCGRGSAAASCVAYCLGITNVDPIRYNLFFERFLNPGRKDPPDIDVDFAWDERDCVLDYVFEKYGEDHVAMVATHLTFQPRMAMRETARVYGLTESEISGVTKKFPYFYQMAADGISVKNIIANHPGTKELSLDPPWTDIIEIAQRLIGLPRGIGTHCGGVVITPEPINTYVPLQRSAKGYQIIQWEKDGAEDMGLVKIDLLGNRSLAVIRDTIANLNAQGIAFDEKDWDPERDQKTITHIAQGNTMGVFYVESPAMRLLQRKTGCGDFEHLTIHSSIIRPAANKYINEYIRRLKGGAYELEHSLLSGVLSETYGIMVYQEDVSRVSMALAGFSSEDADALRKIMSKKDKFQKLNDFRERFIDGSRKKGVTDDKIAKIWQMCLSFTGYSFCKPHSASYVKVSFQSAYLKAHYPAEFMAAVMSNYGGFYTTQAYVSEAMRLGITMKSTDVNRSEEKYVASNMQIQVGLCQIKGLSEKARQKIIRERVSGGIYKTITDLVMRADIDETDMEKLILAGACDTLEFGKNRSKQFWSMRCFYRTGENRPAPLLKPFSTHDLLRSQYKMLGFLTLCHPITLVAGRGKVSTVKIQDLGNYIGKSITFCGWCVTAKTVMTKSGDAMQFVSFEDESGICETVLFPDAYKRFIRFLVRQEAFFVTGKVVEEFGALSVEIFDIRPVL